MIPLMGYEGEYGWYFAIETSYDATGADTYVIRFKAPDGTRTDKTAEVITTLADGDFRWLVTSGFFTKGVWQAQLLITVTGTSVYKGKIHRFEIGPEISAS